MVNCRTKNLVDTLLNQKTFGEKWATWWLDLARYADSKGYEKDMADPYFNTAIGLFKPLTKTCPMDQFTIEQLAGDLLPEPSMDQLIATAFHRNTMIMTKGVPTMRNIALQLLSIVSIQLFQFGKAQPWNVFNVIAILMTHSNMKNIIS